MFRELCARLGYDSGHVPCKQTIAIEDTAPADGSFLIYHFMSMVLKAGSKVLLICTVQTANHYTTVAAKLGISLSQAINKKQICFCELGEFELFNQESILDRISQKLSNWSGLEETAEHQNSLLIFDSVSVFLDLGCSMSEVYTFLLKYNKLAKRNGGILVFIVNSDHDSVSAQSEGRKSSYEMLTGLCGHMSDMRFLVEPVGSGFSKDVSGQVTICVREATKYTVPEVTRLHYRLGDRSVNFFVPGTAQPVL